MVGGYLEEVCTLLKRRMRTYAYEYLHPFPLSWQDLIHGAPIGKPVASRAKVTAVYGEDDEEEIHFTRM